jgi:DNA integrity scanning protein DisA with diadenylate cyclase activity
MKILYENNYQSVQAMISAPDNVLLSLKGIGPARLRKIRANI